MPWRVFCSAIKQFFTWLVESIGSLFVSAIDGLLGSVPGFDFSTSFVSAGFFGLLDQWFPVDYAVGCVTLWLVLAVSVYVINWVLGLFPTIS